MWNRLKFVRSLTHLYLSTKPAQKEPIQRNLRLNQRFMEYLQSMHPGDEQILPKTLTKPAGPYQQTLHQLDRIICDKASQFSNNEILQYLTICMLQSPRKLIELQFYNLAKCILSQRLSVNELTPPQIVQFMFMLALKKKTHDSRRQMKNCLLSLEEDNIYKSLTLMELLIVCNATFKTSTRIFNNSVLETLQESLYNNLRLLNDPGMFITMVKTYRHNECQTEEMLETISATIFFNQTYKHYTFTAIGHILALYADYYYYDEQLFNLLTQSAMEQLKHSRVLSKTSYFTDNIRGKDIKRFLWCSYYVGHTLSQDNLSLCADKLHALFLNGNLDDEPDTLFDSIFYLWMLGYQSDKLLNTCRDKIHRIRRMRANKSKIRVNILLVCLQIENINLYKQFGYKAEVFKLDTMKEFERRPHLQTVYNVIKTFLGDLDVNRLEFEHQIPHVNIMGITGYRKNIYKAFVVDILDETNSMKNISGQGSGLMKLKIRLLYKMNVNHILLNFNEFKDLNEAELLGYIRQEMSVVF